MLEWKRKCRISDAYFRETGNVYGVESEFRKTMKRKLRLTRNQVLWALEDLRNSIPTFAGLFPRADTTIKDVANRISVKNGKLVIRIHSSTHLKGKKFKPGKKCETRTPRKTGTGRGG